MRSVAGKTVFLFSSTPKWLVGRFSFAGLANGKYQHQCQRLEYGDEILTQYVVRVFCIPAHTPTPLSAYRDAPHLLPSSAAFGHSNQVCASYCSTFSGALYAGVEGGTNCYCGTDGEDFSKNGALDEESCATLCDSNPDATCGGVGAIEVGRTAA